MKNTLSFFALVTLISAATVAPTFTAHKDDKSGLFGYGGFLGLGIFKDEKVAAPAAVESQPAAQEAVIVGESVAQPVCPIMADMPAASMPVKGGAEIEAEEITVGEPEMASEKMPEAKKPMEATDKPADAQDDMK